MADITPEQWEAEQDKRRTDARRHDALSLAIEATSSPVSGICRVETVLEYAEKFDTFLSGEEQPSTTTDIPAPRH